MVVCCYFVQQHLHLAWFNLEIDWTIFNPEPLWLPAVLTTQRRQSPKLMFMCQRVWSEGRISKLITSKEQILVTYADVFDGIGHLPGSPYHIQVGPSVTPKQTLCQPIPIHLKEAFKKEIDKKLQVVVLKPVDQATPWINSFVLVEG